jgi:SAM-dependent methyltransferase
VHPLPENLSHQPRDPIADEQPKSAGETISHDLYGMDPSRTEDYDAIRLEVIRQRWDQKADRWDADLADQCCHLNQDDAYHRFLDTADALVAARASFCRERLLIDLACGTGLILAHFADRFERALGIDISPRMLAAATARRLPRAEFLQASCFELAGRVAPAGAVLSRGILLSHYGPRWALPLLRHVREILVPDGGFAVLDFLNALTRHDYPANPDNKTYYTAQQIQFHAAEAGFRRGSILGEPDRRVLMLLAER